MEICYQIGFNIDGFSFVQNNIKLTLILEEQKQSAIFQLSIFTSFKNFPSPWTNR